ncbi:MAG: glycosyltransferase [Akkermansiaceae bacterium]|jgi:glycosyltransferase involved in cell wall biosynthesis
MPLHLNIIARTNGVGLDRDVDLIHEVATAAGYDVTVSHCRSIPFYAGWFGATKSFDANIFLERISPRWIGSAHTNILIPNQERYPERQVPLLKKMDHIFCKSRHALKVFEKHHPSCHHSSFTSRDLFLENLPRRREGVLHLAGRSTLKGTESIIGQWERHPEWPKLTLLQHKENAPVSVPRNVNLRTEYLSEKELQKLMNEHPIHLCPSLSEGWGHYIVEAMSCGATVITTDAPPMNELVKDDRGILSAWSKSEQRNLGTNFHVTPDAFENAIKTALRMNETARAEMGQAARTWMLQNDKTFRDTLVSLMNELIKPQPVQK